MVTQCYNLVTNVNFEKERMYVCKSETIAAVVGSLDFGKKKILLFAEIIVYLHVAICNGGYCNGRCNNFAGCKASKTDNNKTK